MGSLFSNISGQFGKSFVIAALLPATIFVLVLYFFILPMAPLQFGAIGRLQAIEAQWQVGAGVAVATIVATLLYSLNYLLLRLYEGYGWELSPIGRALTNCQRRRSEKEIEKREKIDALWPPEGSELRDYADDLCVAQHLRYPTTSFLPTRFGNRLRAFEEYPQRQYNLEAIRLWPHFVSELDKDHAAAVDDAKSGVDIFVNLSFLSYVSFVAMLLLGIWIPIPMASPPLLVWWIVRMAIALIAGILLYCAAVAAAGGWGEVVRATFDLRRAEVLKRFGYDMPDDLEIERALWQAISWQLIYEGPTEEKARWHYRGGPFFAPFDVDVKLSRSVDLHASPPNAEGAQTVRLVVHNTGAYPIDELTVVDRIGDALLVSDSATIDGVPYEPVGTKQLAFRLPPLPAGAHAVIAYQLWSHEK
jgi:hypothetical protein